MKYRILILLLIVILTGCTSRGSDLEIQIDNLQEDLLAYKTREVELNEINSTMSERVDELEQELLTTSSELSDMRIEKVLLEKDLVQLSNELKECNDMLKDLERNINRNITSYIYDIDNLNVGDKLGPFEVSEISHAKGDSSEYVMFSGEFILKGEVVYDIRTDDELRIHLRASEVFSDLPLSNKNIEYVMEKDNSYSLEGLSNELLIPYSIQDVIEAEGKTFYIVAICDQIVDVNHPHEGALSYVNVTDILYFEPSDENGH